MENGQKSRGSLRRPVTTGTEATETTNENQNGSQNGRSLRRNPASSKNTQGPRDEQRLGLQLASSNGKSLNGASPKARKGSQSLDLNRKTKESDGSSSEMQAVRASEESRSIDDEYFEDMNLQWAQEKDIPIDVCASLLATIDTRGYQRAMISDAHQISRHFLEPMSFPWNYRGPPLSRNQAFDLEEMPAILEVDDSIHFPFANGRLGFGSVDGAKQRQSSLHAHHSSSHHKIKAATRRSEDPGVIEMASFCLPPCSSVDTSVNFSRNQSYKKKSTLDPSLGEERVTDQTGEHALRSYEFSQEEDRRGAEQSKTTYRKTLVSVRARGTSTRSTILHKGKGQHFKALVLQASFPRSTNLTWARKLRAGADASRSLLSGEILEGSQRKRPKLCNVVIRVNGALHGEDSCDEEDRLKRDENDFLLNNHEPTPQCSLDSTKLVQSMIERTDNEFLRRKRKRSEEDDQSRLFINIQDLNCTVLPPRIEAVPDCNGVLTTMCSQAGTISLNASLGQTFRELGSRIGQGPVCTICWESGVQPVISCRNCKVSIHQACSKDLWHAVPSDEKTEQKMICAKCKLAENSKNAQCFCCPYRGGAMSRQNNESNDVWIHEICRIWTSRAPSSRRSCPFKGPCALCGKGENEDRNHGGRGLVKCSAAMCQVWFHPMCAMICHKVKQALSAESSSTDDSSVDFHLTAVRCFSIQGRNVKDSGGKNYSIVPVAFCAAHNPVRREQNSSSRGSCRFACFTDEEGNTVNPVHIPASYEYE